MRRRLPRASQSVDGIGRARFGPAEVAGARNSPQSALHLKRAREQIDTGKGLIQEGENERAEWVLRRAQADAELALSLATEEAQRKKATDAKEELEQLRASMQRRSTREP